MHGFHTLLCSGPNQSQFKRSRKSRLCQSTKVVSSSMRMLFIPLQRRLLHLRQFLGSLCIILILGLSTVVVVATASFSCKGSFIYSLIGRKRKRKLQGLYEEKMDARKHWLDRYIPFNIRLTSARVLAMLGPVLKFLFAVQHRQLIVKRFNMFQNAPST